jgi:hypothetical protein
MKIKFLIATVIGGSLFFASCKKDKESVQDSVTYQITPTGTSSTPGRVNTSEYTGSSGRIEGDLLTWTDGYITTSEIKFEAKGDNKVEYKSKVTRQIDLFDAIATIGDITVPAGNYEKIEFKTTLVPDGRFAAFELTGVYIKNGIPVPVTLRFDSPIQFKFEKKTPTVIDANTGISALHSIALDLLTSDLSVEMLNNAVTVNNSIVISSNSNAGLFKVIWHSLEGGIIKVEIKKK